MQGESKVLISALDAACKENKKLKAHLLDLQIEIDQINKQLVLNCDRSQMGQDDFDETNIISQDDQAQQGDRSSYM